MIEGQVNRIDKIGATGRHVFGILSIKYRLPLLIGVLLSSVVVLFVWASYRAMKESSQTWRAIDWRNAVTHADTSNQYETTAAGEHAVARDRCHL